MYDHVLTERCVIRNHSHGLIEIIASTEQLSKHPVLCLIRPSANVQEAKFRRSK